MLLQLMLLYYTSYLLNPVNILKVINRSIITTTTTTKTDTHDATTTPSYGVQKLIPNL